MVDMRDSKSRPARGGGSSPLSGTSDETEDFDNSWADGFGEK